MPGKAGKSSVSIGDRAREKYPTGPDDGNWNRRTVDRTRIEVTPMRKGFMILPLLVLWAGAAFAQSSGATSSPHSIRPIGLVTKLQPASLTFHPDPSPHL